jgi:hypothetical protein
LIENIDSKNGIYKFISASHDQSLMIWEWNRKNNSVDHVEVCIGHKESVECIDVDPTSTKVILNFVVSSILLLKIFYIL